MSDEHVPETGTAQSVADELAQIIKWTRGNGRVTVSQIVDVLRNREGVYRIEAARATRTVPATTESPILAFQEWALRWCADNGRKLTQSEYGIAMAAFYAAHPGEGPHSVTMSPPATAAQDEAMKAAKLVQDAINDDPRMLDDQVGLAGVISRALATPPSERIAEGQCTWTLDSNEMCTLWEPSCGADPWQFEVGGPAANKMKFCCFCAKPLVESIPSPPSTESEDDNG